MHSLPIVPLVAATQTVSGIGPVVDLAQYRTAFLALDITAVVGGGPSLNVWVETAPISAPATWREVGHFSVVSGVTREQKRFPGADRYLRARWAITGTGASFTFSLSGEKRLVYADPGDVKRITLAAKALVDSYSKPVEDSAIGEFIEYATDDLDDVFGAAKYSLPLATWGTSTRRRCAERAAFLICRSRGLPPEDPATVSIMTMNAEVDAWLTRVQRHEISPIGNVDQTPEVEDGGAYVISSPARGWGARW